MKYWFIIDNVQMGPMTLDEVKCVSGLSLDTPVWFEGLPDWTTVRNIPELAALFNVPAEPEQGAHPGEAPTQGYNPNGQWYGAQGYAQGGYQQGYAQGGYQQGGYRYAPGQQPEGQQPPMPNNYLVWAILVTICCCIVTGVVAIVYASKVSPAYYRGDYLGAQQASEKASMWVIISFVLGLIVQPFYTLFTLMSGAGDTGLF